MAYSAGGLIQATDYNNLINGTNQLNTVWGVGTGDAGYGQSNVSVVSASTTVTATQWASLINTLNNARLHQTGSGSGISAVTTGQRIDYLSTLQTQVNSAYTSRTTAATNGSTSTGTNNNWNPSSAATVAFNGWVDCNVTFTSTAHARYFFNAGGKINWYCSAVDNAGTARSQSLRDLVNNIGGIGGFAYTSNTGRLGSGGTLATNDTTKGYYDIVYNSPTTVIDVTDAAPYATTDAYAQVFGGANDAANGGPSSSVVFRLVIAVPADDANGGSFDCTITTRADIVYPESTYLTNTWGTPTITFDNA